MKVENRLLQSDQQYQRSMMQSTILIIENGGKVLVIYLYRAKYILGP